MAQYRHGDVMVETVEAVPDDARRLQPWGLAEGELTGHSHRVAERDSAVLWRSDRGMFLSVTGASATLVHQEHGPIVLPRGAYRVWQQREYSPREIRVVRD